MRAFTTLVIETEAQPRTMLRLSLEPEPSARGEIPLRQGRAIGWIKQALEPLRPELGEERVHWLALSFEAPSA